MIKITKCFYDDHESRDLIAPPILRETKQHYFIDDAYTPEMEELISDARYYVNVLELGGWQDEYVRGIARSARALLRAMPY